LSSAWNRSQVMHRRWPPLRFVPLPPPTTAEVEELTVRIADRCTTRLTAAEEERGDYLDPNLAALVEALFWARNPPAGTRDIPCLPGMEGVRSEEDGLRGKPLCATVAGFSLHAAQSVPAHDRDALERLCRYGLRAPFSSERLSRRPDGKVVYQLRRPWPNPQGMTHLILDPLDFLRRLSALVSFPYSHQVRYHGVFSNHSKSRRQLPPPPPSPRAQELEAMPSAEAKEPARTGAQGGQGIPSRMSRKRTPWAQLLLRVLQVNALACPRCSLPGQPVPMVVLAFLTDPEVVVKILKHLGLPTTAPALAPARSSGRVMGFALGEGEVASASDLGNEAEESSRPEPPIRPPP
jgi:hypothetical protein